MTYYDLLINPEISLDCLRSVFPCPRYLYKYQSFYSDQERTIENQYWIRNLEGEFHLSLGCDFEDEQDCKPNFNEEKTLSYLQQIFDKQVPDEAKLVKSVFNAIDKDEEARKEFICWAEKAAKNWQSEIRIGCFTVCSNNEKMWDQYAGCKTGYCIEYDTTKYELFNLLTLPVAYSNIPFDLSEGAAIQIFLELWKDYSDCDEQKLIEAFPELLSRQKKLTWTSVFIKNTHYFFEEEYRMFLPKHISVGDIKLRRECYLDANKNIDLSDAVSAIYLGEEFGRNTKAAERRNIITEIANQKGIRVYER